MGLLTADYYTNLMKNNPIPESAPSPTPQPVIQSTDVNSQPTIDPISSVLNKVAPLNVPQISNTSPAPTATPVATNPNGDYFQRHGIQPISDEEQIKKFGGVVGSPEYQAYWQKNSLKGVPGVVVGTMRGSAANLQKAFGIDVPTDEELDRMPAAYRAALLVSAPFKAAINMIAGLPKAFVQAPLRVAVTTIAPFEKMARGEDVAYSSMKNDPARISLPWVGEIPTYYQSYADATKSGMGPGAATISTIGSAAGDAALTGSLVEAMAGAFRPRAQLKPGETVTNNAPIQQAINQETGVFQKKAPSSSEYYTLPQTIAKEKYGGNSSNTFLKITPAADGQMEVSVVQTRAGGVRGAVDYVKTKLGTPIRTTVGDFGPEVKLDSGMVKVGDVVKPGENMGTTVYRASSESYDPKKAGSAGVFVSPSENIAGFFNENGKSIEKLNISSNAKILEWKDIPEELKNFDGKDIEQAQSAIADYARSKGYDVVNYEPKDGYPGGIEHQVVNPDILKSIPPEAPAGSSISITRPLKAFEDKPITSDQMANVQKIGEVNGIDPAIRESVIKTLTGKNTLGELTQKEYADVAQTLGSFNDLKKYAPPEYVPNLPARYISPQRYWMRTVEQKTGVPLYSEGYVPIEDAARMRNTFRESYRNQAREIFGKYAGPGQGEVRRAIFNYMQGDKGAVTAFDPATQADIVRISNEMRPLYDKLGNTFGIPTDVFLKDYQPHIQNVGGVYQLYKDGQNIPKEMSFFADFKRHGSVNVQLDDALALFDIYTNAGSNKIFMNPALERVAKLGENVPKNLQASLKSYIQEKLGYAGPLEEWLNTMGTNIGSKIGLNVPADIARQVTDTIMSTIYSGAMGLNPGTAVRNSLQGPLMTYPRLGLKFYGEALKTALTKEGMAEFKSSGFTVNTGSPYGEAVAENATPLDAVMNRYKQVTQGTLGIHSIAENLNRAQAYFQVKYQFEDALSRYNSGQITWPKFEQEIDLKSLNPVDRNIVRQKLASGDIQGAREHLTRDVLDETQFPYRRGSGARINYGLTGKLTTQFSQWSIEFAHTLAKWTADGFKRGDFSKLIRFAAASSAIQQTFKNNFNIDFSKSVGAAPLGVSLAPLVQTGFNFLQMVNAAKAGNDEEYTKNRDAIFRQTQLLYPAGGIFGKGSQFYKSFTEGPDKNDEYAIRDSKGRLLYRTGFKDLFWTALGFPSSEKADVYAKNSAMQNAQFERTQQKSQILQLMQQQKFQQAAELMAKTGIQVTADDMKQFYIPLDDRTFQSLPPILKARFANLVYPPNK